jgi:hypothetical protein
MLRRRQARKQQTENIMSTYTYNLIAGMPLGGVHAHNLNTANIAKRAKNIALFLIAPFVGLAYLLAFPVIGFGMLVWVAAKAVMKSGKARPVALAIAAPVIALGFVTVGPLVALGALAFTGAKALLKA